MRAQPVLQTSSTSRRLAGVAALAALASGCVNTGSQLSSEQLAQLSGSKPTATASASPPPSVQGDFFKIANVTVAAAQSASAAPTFTLFIDPTKSKPATGTAAPMLNSHCAASGAAGAQNALPCVCQFTWTETNGTSGTNVNFKRTVETPVTNAQQALVSCPAPDVFNTEIQDGTSIKITVLPGPSNQTLFSVSTHNFVRNVNASAGSFLDAEGRAFENVRHYACYEQFKRGSAIQSRVETRNNSQTGESVTHPQGTKFCVQGGSGGNASTNCPDMPATLNYSAQAYYYNFYVRATESGDVNQWNDRFACPVVKESLNNVAGTVGGQGQLWPMDTTFALSMGKTADFNVGVDAFVELANGGADPVSKNSKACNGTVPAGNGSTTGFVQGCLGFARKPNADGTCPHFRDKDGLVRHTYRLRRLVALYPPVFETDGKAPTTPQPTDTIYVLDRPVTGNTDVLKPYTMRGPKPCPFALYDGRGVTQYSDPAYDGYGNNLPIYAATNNPAWNGTNVDGIQFPNYDGANSCAATFPIVKSDPFNADIASVSLATVHGSNPVFQRQYVRPITAWAPHYEEDTEFQACAPQASPMKDPPLHFAKDPTNGNVSWCAESYPSQNDHVPALDRVKTPGLALSGANPYIGHVRPYTSHVTKNSASASCVATIPATIPSALNGVPRYPNPNAGASCPADLTTVPAPQGLAWHPQDAIVDTVDVWTLPGPTHSQKRVCAHQTCDRTAIAAGGLGWQNFPLLAAPHFLEQAIGSDTTYGCVVTWDNGNNKTGKKTPTGGCCGANVHLKTGLANGSNTKELVNMSAHLEPDASCLIPQY